MKNPGLVSFDVTLRPLLGQRSWAGQVPSASGSIERLDGRGAVHLLSAAPVSLTLDGFRISDDQVLRYGAEQAFDNAGWSGRLEANWKPLPLSLEYRDESRRLADLPRPGELRLRDQSWRRVRVKAENRKTDLEYDHIDYTDRIGPTDYVQDRFRANHRFRWGKGSRLTSLFQYLDRDGYGSIERLRWRQQAWVQHTNSVASDLSYSLYDETMSTDFRRGWRVDYAASWRPSNQTRVSIEGLSRRIDMRLSDQGYARVGPRAAVRVPLGRALEVRVVGGLGYEWHDQDTSEGGIGTVVDERHVVSPSGSFFLDEPFAIPTTVVIKSTDNSLIYEPGLDYRLVPTGALLEVVSLPGGRLGPGVVVLADYSFELLPGGSATAWTYDYDATLTAGPLAIYHRRARQQERGDGPPTPISSLREYDDQTFGLRLSGSSPIGTLSLTAEYDEQSARTFDFSGYHVRGSWGFLIRPRLRGQLSGGWSRRENGVKYEIWESESSLEWAITPDLRVAARLAAYDWTEVDLGASTPGTRAETFLGGGLGAEWRVNRLVVSARFDRNAWTRGFERTEDRLYVKIARQF